MSSADPMLRGRFRALDGGKVRVRRGGSEGAQGGYRRGGEAEEICMRRERSERVEGEERRREKRRGERR
jgi:hypothetical protein